MRMLRLIAVVELARFAAVLLIHGEGDAAWRRRAEQREGRIGDGGTGLDLDGLLTEAEAITKHREGQNLDSHGPRLSRLPP